MSLFIRFLFAKHISYDLPGLIRGPAAKQDFKNRNKKLLKTAETQFQRFFKWIFGQ